jgi:hypothetical protein
LFHLFEQARVAVGGDVQDLTQPEPELRLRAPF